MIYTLTGTNSFLLKADLKQHIDKFVKEYGEFGLEKLSADEVSITKILEVVQAMPFLADKRLVVIESAGSNKDLNEKIQDLFKLINDQTDLILVEPKFDKRSSLYKTLKKETEFTEFADMDESGLANWLVMQAKEQGGDMGNSDARYLVQRVGNNQLKLSNEISKLISYKSKVDRQSIDLLTERTPQSTIFDLLDSAFSGNHKKAMQLYAEQRKQKVEPANILALLSWQLHILATVKSAGDKQADEIARAAKLNPYVIRKSVTLARGISMSELKSTIERTLQLDLKLKTQSIDADEALQNLLISL